jgi:hypothetical protein
MDNMQIIDDFLSEEMHKDIVRAIDGLYFPWYYRDHSSYQADGVPQFIHVFYRDDKITSEFYYMVEALKLMLELKTEYEIDKIQRAKANLMLNVPIKDEDIKKAIHQDRVDKGYISLLYYVEDSDGDTIIYSKDKKKEMNKASPKANRAVIFKSDEWHNATPPKKYPTRKVINIIFKVK